MSEFFDVLDKREAMDRLCKSIMPDDTADVLEKGKKADIGEIRNWGGHKYQKTAAGWIMVGKSEQPKDNKGTSKESETGKTNTASSSSKVYKKGDYVTAKNSDGVTIKGKVFEIDDDGKYMKIRTTSGDLEYIETKKVKAATGDEQDRIYSTFAKKKFAGGKSYNDDFGD